MSNDNIKKGMILQTLAESLTSCPQCKSKEVIVLGTLAKKDDSLKCRDCNWHFFRDEGERPGQTRQIVVLPDGETWAELCDSCVVMTVSKAGMEELLDGYCPKHLEEEDIISRESIGGPK